MGSVEILKETRLVEPLHGIRLKSLDKFRQFDLEEPIVNNESETNRYLIIIN